MVVDIGTVSTTCTVVREGICHLKCKCSPRCCGYLSEISSSLRDFYIFSFFLYYNIDSKKIPLGGDVLDEEMLKILQTKTGNNVVICLIS